jgi:hypothetical protein
MHISLTITATGTMDIEVVCFGIKLTLLLLELYSMEALDQKRHKGIL